MVTLRLLTEDDLEFLLEIRNHTSTRQFLLNTSLFTLTECKEWYSNLLYPYYIIENKLGERVGYFRTNGNIIGCDIHMDYRRKGYAKEAYIEYLKDKNYARLYVLDTNFAKKLYEQLEFKYTGITKKFKTNNNWLEMEWKRK